MADININKIKIGDNIYVLHDEILDLWRGGLNGFEKNTVESAGYVVEVDQIDGKISYKHAKGVSTISDNMIKTNLVTAGAVKTYVDSMVAGAAKIQIVVLENDGLPDVTDEANHGIIYLVPDSSHSDDRDIFDEYIAASDSTGANWEWEKIGNTDVSLSGLVTDVSATFSGTAASHNHTWTQGTSDFTYYEAAGATSSYNLTSKSDAAVTVEFTPRGTVTVNHTTGSTISAITGITPTSVKKSYMTGVSISHSVSDGILTLSLTPTADSNVSFLTGIGTPTTATAISSINSANATFTGSKETISVPLPTIETTVLNKRTSSNEISVTGTIANTSITPTGTVTVNTTKHS